METARNKMLTHGVWPKAAHRASRDGWLWRVAVPLGGCLLMVVAAQCRFPIPGTDVPMTLQPVAMLLVGMTLRVSGAATAMFLYLLLGGIGLPVFAGDGGLTGMTGGYLVGLLVAAPVVGTIAGVRRGSFVRLFVAGLVGMVVLLTFGVAWRVVGFPGGFEWAVVTGAVPFLAKSVVEAALAAGVARQWNKRKIGKVGV